MQLGKIETRKREGGRGDMCDVTLQAHPAFMEISCPVGLSWSLIPKAV